MEWPQKATDIICDSRTADGIANSTIKHQCLCAMNRRYFWIIDQVQNLSVCVQWAPGLENLVDYFAKHHIAAHHTQSNPTTKICHSLHMSCPMQLCHETCKGVLNLPIPVTSLKPHLLKSVPCGRCNHHVAAAQQRQPCRKHKNPTLTMSTNQTNRSSSLF